MKLNQPRALPAAHSWGKLLTLPDLFMTMKLRLLVFCAVGILFAGIPEAISAQEASELHAKVGRLYQQDRYEEAVPLAHKLVVLRKVRAIEEPENYATSLNILAVLHKKTGAYEKAEPLYLEAKAIRAKVLGEKHRDYAQSLNNLASLYQAMKAYAKAEPLYLEAKAIWAKEDRDYTTILHHLGSLYQDMGANEKAVPLFVEATAILANQVGKSHPMYAKELDNVARLYHEMGAYKKAEPLYLECKAIFANVWGEDHPDYATRLNNLALLYKAMGAYEKAEPLYRQALALVAKVRGEQHPSYATCLDNLAVLYQNIGAYDKAESMHLEATAIFAKVLGEEHRDYATSLNNLAGLYEKMGAYEKAVSLYLQANAINAKVLGEEHPAYATSLDNLSSLYAVMGAYEKAEPLYLEAKAIFAKVWGKEHPSYATSLSGLALLYHDTGAYEKAEPLLLEAEAIDAKVVGKEHPHYATSLHNLAFLYMNMEQPAQAIPLAQQQIHIVRILLGRVVGAFPEKDRESYVGSLYLHHLPCSLENGPLAAESLLAFKGAIGASLLEERRLLGASDRPEAREQVEKLQSLRQQFHHATLQGQKERADKLFAEIETVEGALARFVSGLGAARKSLQVQPAEVQAQIPATAALIELIRYRRPIRDENQNKWEWESRYGAAVIRHEGDPTFVRLALADEIDEAVGRFRQLAESGGSEEDCLRACGALYGMLLEPLEAAIGGAETLVISPDSHLHFLSFDALLNAKGRMACEKWNIRYTETGRDLLDQRNHTTGSRNQNALLLGDPLYNQNPGDQPTTTSQALDPSTSALLESLNRDAAMPGSFIAKTRSGNGSTAGWESLNFNALPGTGAELLKLGTLLESKRWKVEKLLQADASESKLRGLTQGPAILHLATHGFFVNAPEDDSLDRNPLGASEFLANSAMKPSRPPTDPMLRSGMALTGAQHTLKQWSTGQVPDPGNDGMLLAAEVVNYNLSGTELVVLSACETAKGKTLDGEGIYGLRRALKMAGADSVVMTLWPVNDDYTVDFMKDFYTRYLSGMHPCRALAETKKEHLLKLKADPARGFAAAVKLVAPFIATGKGVEAVK